MNLADNLKIASNAPGTLEPQPQPVPAGSWIKTRKANSDETGYTVVDDKGEGLFITQPSGGNVDGPSAVPAARNQSEARVSVSDLYPHWQDSESEAGMTLLMLKRAVDDLQAAIETGAKSRIELLNAMALVEGTLFRALEYSKFSEPLESVVSFCAWALRNSGLSDPHSSSLQGMSAVLRELQEQPFLNINRATELIVRLESQGWSGESPISFAFQEGLAMEAPLFADTE